MNRMTKEEMIEFLKGMDQRRQILEEEKRRVRGSVETLEEAIQRNNFSRNTDESGIIASGFSPDKVLRVLLNSERDIEEETRAMVKRMREILETEDQIDFVRWCLFQIPAREQQVLRELYVNDVVIEALAEQMCLSTSYLYKLRSRAMNRLLSVYNSRCESRPYTKAERLIRDVRPYMPEGSVV